MTDNYQPTVRGATPTVFRRFVRWIRGIDARLSENLYYFKLREWVRYSLARPSKVGSLMRLVQHHPDAMMVALKDGTIPRDTLNVSARIMLGLAGNRRQNLLPLNHDEIVRDCLTSGLPIEFNTLTDLPNGTRRLLHWQYFPDLVWGQVQIYCSNSQDYHPLTGLLGKDYYLELQRDRRKLAHGTHEGILAIDIDKFKLFNDTYGHSTGDAVLQALAHVLRLSIRSIDEAIHPSGDEFFVVLRSLPSSHDEAQEIARTVAERISETFRNITHLEGLEDRAQASLSKVSANYEFSVSIGAVIYSHDTEESFASNLHRADGALYWFKRLPLSTRPALAFWDETDSKFSQEWLNFEIGNPIK